MLAYYEKLAKKTWPFQKRDWNIYNDQLRKEGAPKAITKLKSELIEMLMLIPILRFPLMKARLSMIYVQE